jgi:hypothetical protein
MQGRTFSPRDLSAFHCAKPIRYGSPITIMRCFQQGGNDWLADVLVAPQDLESIRTSTNRVPGENFVVLGCRAARDMGFSHYAVSVEKLDESSQAIEESITRVLRAITNGAAKQK